VAVTQKEKETDQSKRLLRQADCHNKFNISSMSLDLCSVGIRLPNKQKNSHCFAKNSATEQVAKFSPASGVLSSSVVASSSQSDISVLEDDLNDLYDSDSEKNETTPHLESEAETGCGNLQLQTSLCQSFFRPKEGVFVWNIPDELLFYIGLRLGWERSAFCCEVSKKWCAILRCDAIWSTFLRQREMDQSIIHHSAPKIYPQVTMLFSSCIFSE
jgi:hypothetical protein